MGYDGKKIAELKLRQDVRQDEGKKREESVGGREVGKFWGKSDVALFIIAIVMLSFVIFSLFTVFSPSSSPREQQEGQQKRQFEPLAPPLLFRQFRFAPRPLPPSGRQKRKSAVPIRWSDHYGHGGHHGHHGDGYHGHHDYGYYPYSYPYYSYPIRPWGGYYSPLYPYSGCYGCDYGRGYGEEEGKSPYFELRRTPGETWMRWGFQ